MKPRSTWPLGLAALAVMMFAAPSFAEVKLPSVIADNMVLQRGMKIPIWGTASPGEEVTVTLNGKSAREIADKDGRWMVKLPKQKAGGPFELQVAGSNAITLKNVLIGEVWVCSGQSNMAWTVRNSNNPDEEIANAKHPMIRLFTVPRLSTPEPKTDVEADWQVCTPETIPNFSAVAYFFGRKLHQDLGVAVGLINTSYGGTPTEAWTRYDVLQSEAAAAPIVERYATSVKNQEQIQKQFQERLASWREAAAKARGEGTRVPRRPRAPYGPGHSHAPGGLYNAMIAPLLPYAIRGAIWYQGESNASRAYQYRTLFPLMIRNWRHDWGQGKFPFYWVQLANFRARKDDPGDSDWAELREAQSMALKLKNTGEAVIIDIGEAGNIHPRNKQDVGKRLAVWALAKNYRRHVVRSGPRYDSMTVEGNRIRLTFKHVAGGVTAKGGLMLEGFAIAGQDRKFVWASARIEGDTIVVWSSQVLDPASVRYAWADNPVCNLYNQAGLPASPFRTDRWPGITVNNK